MCLTPACFHRFSWDFKWPQCLRSLVILYPKNSTFSPSSFPINRMDHRVNHFNWPFWHQRICYSNIQIYGSNVFNVTVKAFSWALCISLVLQILVQQSEQQIRHIRCHDATTLSLNGKSWHEIKSDPICFLNPGAVVTFYSNFKKVLHLWN